MKKPKKLPEFNIKEALKPIQKFLNDPRVKRQFCGTQKYEDAQKALEQLYYVFNKRVKDLTFMPCNGLPINGFPI